MFLMKSECMMTQGNRGTPIERLLTIKEVAERDACSEKTVRRAIEAGRLEALRLGPDQKLIRITPEAHRRYRNGARR